METRVLKDSETKVVYTLNTWTGEKIDEVKDWLKKGYYVKLDSSAIGHMMALMVENDAINRVKKIYGDRLEVVIRDGWGDRYCRLLEK